MGSRPAAPSLRGVGSFVLSGPTKWPVQYELPPAFYNAHARATGESFFLLPLS